MNKLFKAELKKIFLRPGIFVMTALLALILALSYFLYNPVIRSTTQISIDKPTLSEIYNYYATSSLNYSKSDADTHLRNANSMINEYKLTLDSSKASQIREQVDLVNINLASFMDFANRARSNWDYKETAEKIRISQVLPSLNELEQTYTNYSNASKPSILVSTKSDNKIKSMLTSIQKILTSQVDPTIETYNNFVSNLSKYNLETNKNKFKMNITDDFYGIQDIQFEEEFLNDLSNNYVKVCTDRLIEVDKQINEFYENFGGQLEYEKSYSKIDELNVLISKYYNNNKQLFEIIQSKIYLSIASDYSDYEIKQYKGLENFNRYESEQSLTRQEYLFKNDKMEYDYAKPFSVLSTSNFESNAFDFMYFVLELFSFVIIIYCVVIGSSMIAGEQNNGTLKLLAIRPYNRSKIMTSKILATTFFALVFTLLATIITFIAGGIMFGFGSAPILCIFNASFAFEMSPILLSVIYLCSLMLKITTYIILAFTISTLFKSYVGAVTVSIFCFFGAGILNLYVASNNIIKYLPLNNLDLFKYFGGGMFGASSSSLFNIFSTPILPDMNFVFSLINIIITITILLVVTYTVFKKRYIA